MVESTRNLRVSDEPTMLLRNTYSSDPRGSVMEKACDVAEEKNSIAPSEEATTHDGVGVDTTPTGKTCLPILTVTSSPDRGHPRRAGSLKSPRIGEFVAQNFHAVQKKVLGHQRKHSDASTTSSSSRSSHGWRLSSLRHPRSLSLSPSRSKRADDDELWFDSSPPTSAPNANSISSSSNYNRLSSWFSGTQQAGLQHQPAEGSLPTHTVVDFRKRALPATPSTSSLSGAAAAASSQNQAWQNYQMYSGNKEAKTRRSLRKGLANEELLDLGPFEAQSTGLVAALAALDTDTAAASAHPPATATATSPPTNFISSSKTSRTATPHGSSSALSSLGASASGRYGSATSLRLRSGSVVTVISPETDAWERTVYLNGPIRLDYLDVKQRKDSIASMDAFVDAIEDMDTASSASAGAGAGAVAGGGKGGGQRPARRTSSDDQTIDEIVEFFEGFGFDDFAAANSAANSASSERREVYWKARHGAGTAVASTSPPLAVST